MKQQRIDARRVPSAFIAALVVAAASAPAAVVHRTFSQIADVMICFNGECPPADSEYALPFDFDADGAPDFHVLVVADGAGGNDLYLVAGPGGAVGEAVPAGQAVHEPLTALARVRMATLFTPGYGSHSGTLGCSGCRAIFPLRFRAADGLHRYAWVQLRGEAPSFLLIEHGSYESEPGRPIIAGTVHTCGSADFDCDGDTATDADIEAFFACLAGTCPVPPCTSSEDFDGDGDAATDADVEAFFRVLGGGTC